MGILIVDNNDGVLQLLRLVLELEGYRVINASSGPEALSFLDRSRPEAVILDVQMPEMDGWEVLATIRAQPKTATLPVILCTVKGSAIDAARGWELGCDAYVDKPFVISHLLNEIRDVMSRSPDDRISARAAELSQAKARLGSPHTAVARA